jgi:hypothetical protein
MELPTAAMLLKPGLEVDAFLDRFQIPDSTRNMHVRRMVSHPPNATAINSPVMWNMTSGM